MTDSIPLADLAPKLRENYARDTTYRRLHLLALDGRLPGAHRGSNGRWLVDLAALPSIAENLPEIAA